MDVISLLLWSLFIFLLTIMIGTIVNKTDNFLSEGFGITCVDLIPISYKKYPNYPIRHNTIFVSVASYRDEECSLTLDNLFNNAEFPERIFVGICEQNKEGILNELCINNRVLKYKNNIRITKIDYKQAKGPTYARYYCSKLWRGEQYYLQIDSHVFFEKNWDTDLIHMINQIKTNPNESILPVLSVYPPTKEQMQLKGFPEMDSGKLNTDNILSFLCGWSEPSDIPKRSNKPWAGAGFMFLESHFLYSVPFDPNLSHLFQGEEVLFSARLFTSGYDFYTPNKKICYHHYNRTKATLYHKDIKNSSDCRSKAEKRILFLLGLLPKQSVTDDFLRNVNYYGIGKFRTISDFWKVSGIDFESKTVERWNDNNFPSPKYDGWWFRRDGFEKIKKLI
jgi:[Skp1-protein]-hydroxyproline N-acetylglucosaminyltransferase